MWGTDKVWNNSVINTIYFKPALRTHIEVILQVFILTALSGCVISPVQKLDAKAQALGFDRILVQGREFSHVVYLNRVAKRNDMLHVYLEGDGTPWLYEKFVSSDPTPRNPLMLRLMAFDPESSVYLGRPCYNGLASTPPCEARFWTYARYSETVVNEMAAALRRVIDEGAFHSIALFGYSGGGTIAMLLAEKFPQTRAVVTIAANLDPDAWTEFHGYSPLTTSLNPSARPALEPSIYQLHVAGARDQVVPLEIIQTAVAKQKDANLRIIPDFDHVCCWEKLWPSLLANLVRVELKH